MPRLNDLQRILLSTASQRDDRSLYPLPERITATDGRLASTINSLLKKQLAQEQETADAATVYRSEGDIHYGIFATDAGLAAIGIIDEPEATGPFAPQLKRQTKTAMVVALLERDEGATLVDLIEITGWLPHTTRAALTGLRKKGHAIERSKRDDITCYRVVKAG